MTRTAAHIKAELDTLMTTAGRYQAGMNEAGDGFNPHSERLRTLQAEYDAVREAEVTALYQAQLAAEDAEWTREVTIQRRAAWNAWVRNQGKTIHPATMAAHCKEIGYDMLLLSRQIKRHTL